MRNSVRLNCALLIFTSLALTSCNKEYRLIVGGYTEKEGEKGLSVFSFNAKNGDLKLISESDAGPSPSYFCFSKKNNLFYIANEVMKFNGRSGGGLTTLKYDVITSQFEKLNETAIPNGGPCYISMSADSGYLFAANYPHGSVTVVRLGKNGIPETVTDTILYVKEKPDSSHAHMIMHDPAGRHVYVTDLGLDRVVTYDFDATEGKLKQLENGVAYLPAKSGPRHFTFNPDGTKLYVINELGSVLTVFGIDDKQGLSLLQTLSTKRDSYSGENYCADIHSGKDSKFLYGSNRGENSIVTFKVGNDGLVTVAGHSSCGGNWPRNFVIDPTGKYMLVGNERSNNISVLKIDSKTGLPSDTVRNVKVTSPACLKFY